MEVGSVWISPPLLLASCLFPTVLLLSLHQGRREEMNGTPQVTLPSPQKLGPMPQLPGRLGPASGSHSSDDGDQGGTSTG